VSHNIVVIMCSSWAEIGDIGKSVSESGCQLEWYSWSPRAWSTVNLWVGWLVEEVHAKPLSQCWWWRYHDELAATWCWCRVMPMMALSRRLGHDVMLIQSQADDDATEATWPWRDVNTKLCQWRCCRCDLVTIQCWCWVIPTMTLSGRLDRNMILVLSHMGVDAREPC
jgi:hypothetical protein